MTAHHDTPIVGDSNNLTFAALVKLAEAQLGSRAAVLEALNNLSRQRFQSVIAGGPPLRPERLLSLALAVDVDPSDVLRAGGRAVLAGLLDKAYGGRFRDVSASQRALLRAFDQLGQGIQGVVVQFVARLAAEPAAEPVKLLPARPHPSKSATRQPIAPAASVAVRALPAHRED